MGSGLKGLIAEALADPASSVSQADVFADLAAHHVRRIAAREVKLGLPDPPRNAGQNRTPSKRALLKAIRDAGGEW